MQEETMAISDENTGTTYDAGTAMGETIDYGSTPKNQIATQRQRLRFGKEEQPSGRISALAPMEQSAVCADADAGAVDESLPCAKGGERGLTTPPSAQKGADTVSLRLGHAAALACPRQAIHSRGAASLPLGTGGRQRGSIDDDNRARFRELIGGEYKQAFADEVQRIIDRRFRETKMLKQRVAELEGKASPVQGEVLSEAKRKDCTVGQGTMLDGGVQPLSHGKAVTAPLTQGSQDLTQGSQDLTQGSQDLTQGSHDAELLYAILENDAADQQVRLTAERLKNDVDALRGKYPNLDPDTLLESDNAMRAYLSGASAEDLLWAMHHDRLLADAQSAVVESIRARQERPVENGASGGAAFTVRKDFSKMSLDELEAYGKH